MTLKHVIPFLSGWGNYRSDYLKSDLIAGLTVAMVLIPQSMAYAELAGLPPYYGLYAAFIPPLVAALFGSSRQLATGPVAVVSLMTSVALEPLATTGSQGYIAYAMLLALLVGAFQFALGVLRLGLLVNFLSHPVVNGFTNAAALVIATSQLPRIFGVAVDKAGYHYQTVLSVFQSASNYTHWPTLLMGLTAFTIMIGSKRIWPKSPYVLAAVVATTLISWASGFERSTLVDAAAIKSPVARALIGEFNAVDDALAPLVAGRAEENRLIQTAASTGDEVGEINARRNAQILGVRIEQLKLKSRLLRRRIRQLLFEGGSRPDGAWALFESGKLPDGAKGDGRTWRIQVGNRRLETKGLTVTAGGRVVGSVPRGLPSPAIPRVDIRALLHLLPFAAIISLLGFMEAISVARAMAAKTGQRIDPNRELIGQGLANMLGAVGRSYPVSGSFSRSAVNLQAGAMTGLSSVFTSLVVVLVLLFFTPLLYHLPQSVLAAVIMMAVVGLINIKGIVHTWRAQWYDGAISVITFTTTLLFAPHLERGIVTGVILSLTVFLYKSMRPTVVDLSLGVDRALHDAVAFGLKECRYIDVVRFDGPLFFANASYLDEQIRARRINKDQLKHIIIVANGINDIDASGQESLSFIIDRVRSAGIDISLSGVNESVTRALKRTHLLAKIGEDHIYPTMKAAIHAIHRKTHLGGEEKNCPLTHVVVTSHRSSLKEG